MEKQLILRREYLAVGTIGSLFLGNVLICHTLERKWKNNEKSKSCIPEGTYRLIKRYTSKRGVHVALADTYPRQVILIHAGNDVTADEDVDYDTDNGAPIKYQCLPIEAYKNLETLEYHLSEVLLNIKKYQFNFC